MPGSPEETNHPETEEDDTDGDDSETHSSETEEEEEQLCECGSGQPSFCLECECEEKGYFLKRLDDGGTFFAINLERFPAWVRNLMVGLNLIPAEDVGEN